MSIILLVWLICGVCAFIGEVFIHIQTGYVPDTTGEKKSLVKFHLFGYYLGMLIAGLLMGPIGLGGVIVGLKELKEEES